MQGSRASWERGPGSGFLRSERLHSAIMPTLAQVPLSSSRAGKFEVAHNWMTSAAHEQGMERQRFETRCDLMGLTP